MIGHARMVKGKIALLGGNGMLGTDIAESFIEDNLDVTVFDLPQWDITADADIKKAVDSADIIINCAAYTNVDLAESQYDLACKINAQAVANLAEMVRKNNKYLIHISTDFVFDGKGSEPYKETDQPNPVNAYGKSKLAGEQAVVDSSCDYCIIRVQWTYGHAGNNFVKKLIERAANTKNVKVVDDQVGSPTATAEVAKILLQLVKQKPIGLFHLAADGFVSRYRMAQFIFDYLKMDVNLTPCKTTDFNSPADRPLNSKFNCDKIKSLPAIKISSWQDQLTCFLAKLKS